MPLQAAGRQSLVDTVVDALRAQLAAGEWKVGDRIPTEHALAEQLQVGRNTVREAVRVLVHAGMLRSRQGEGTFVVSTADPGEIMRGIQRSGIRDVLEVRVALEAEAARLAALRHEPADLDRMRTALNAQAALEARTLLASGPAGSESPAQPAKPEESGQDGQPADGSDVERAADHDIAFHKAVVQAAHNAALSALYEWFSGSVREAIVSGLADSGMPPISHGDHWAVLEAISAGDPDAAERAARELLAEPRRAVEQLLDGD